MAGFARFARRIIGLAAIIGLGVALDAGGQPSLAADPDIAIDTGSIVSEGRVRATRTDYDYFFRVDIVNSGVAKTNVTANVATTQTGASIVGGALLDFGAVGAGATVQSLNQIVVRVDRRVRPDVGALVFSNIQFQIVDQGDMTPPVVAITSPLNGATIGADNVDVTGTVDDPTAVVVATVNDGADIPVDAADGSFDINVPLPQEGANTIKVFATDPSNNTGGAMVAVTRDTQAPTATIEDPANGTFTNQANQTVTGTVSEADATVAVDVGGPPVAATVVDTGFSADVVLAEGANTISAAATDAVGNTGPSDSVQVTLDTVDPVVDITSPDVGAEIQASKVTVEGTVEEAVALQSVIVNGVTASVANGAWTAANVLLQVGENSITAIATDQAGNSAQDSIAVTRIAGDEDAPVVAITSPAPGTVLAELSVDVTGTVDDPTAVVTVNGVPAPMVGGAFSVEDVPLLAGPNTVTAVATDDDGNIGIAAIQVTVDVSPPTVSIITPGEGAILTSTQVTVSGAVNDAAIGTINGDDVTVMVNGVEAEVLNRSYMASDVLLVRGMNEIHVVATDQVGNVGEAIVEVDVRDGLGQQSIRIISGNDQEGVIGEMLEEALVVEAVDADGKVLPDLPVTFIAKANDGLLSAFPQEGREVTVFTDEFGRSSAFYTLGLRSGSGANMIQVTAPGFVGEVMFSASSMPGAPANLKPVMGENQRGLGGQDLPIPLAVVVSDIGGNPLGGVQLEFLVVDGGGAINGQPSLIVESDTDGHAGAVHTLGLQTGLNNNIVVVTVIGAPIDPVIFTSSSFASEAGAPTTLDGFVVNNVDLPLKGVKAQLFYDDGAMFEVLTDEEGRYFFPDIPAGHVLLFIDPTEAPLPVRYSTVGFHLTIFPNIANSLGMPVSTPVLDPINEKIIGGPEDVVLTMEGVEGVEFTIFANSVSFPNGDPYVGPGRLNQVHADRVPMPPADGTAPITVWTLQPEGLQFDPPVQVKLPNAQGLPPGAILDILSFDHDIGMYVSVGLGRVSADGAFIITDPGFGIAKAGWGTPAPPPPPQTCTVQCNDQNECTSDSKQDPPCKCTNAPTNNGGQCGGQPGVNSCKMGTCQNGACVGQNKPDNSTCDDGLKCTDPDKCLGGACKGEKKDEPLPVTTQFELGAVNQALQSISKWLALLKLGGVTIKPLPTIGGNLQFKTEMPCCETDGQLKEKSTITGELSIPGYDTGPLIPLIPPWAGDYTFTAFGKTFGLKYGPFVQFSAAFKANVGRSKDECTNTVCWSGGLVISGEGAGGLTGFVPNPASAGDACGQPPPPPGMPRPCNLIGLTGKFTTGLSFGGSVSCEKIEGGVGHNGIVAAIEIQFAEGSFFEFKAGQSIEIVGAGIVANLGISLPL